MGPWAPGNFGVTTVGARGLPASSCITQNRAHSVPTCGNMTSCSSRIFLVCLTHLRTEIAPHGNPWGKVLGKVNYPEEHRCQPQTTANSPTSRLTKGPLPKPSMEFPHPICSAPSVSSWRRSDGKASPCTGRISTLLTCLIAWKAKSQRSCLIHTAVPPTLHSNQMKSWPTGHWPGHKARVAARHLAWVTMASFWTPGVPPLFKMKVLPRLSWPGEQGNPCIQWLVNRSFVHWCIARTACQAPFSAPATSR